MRTMLMSAKASKGFALALVLALTTMACSSTTIVGTIEQAASNGARTEAAGSRSSTPADRSGSLSASFQTSLGSGGSIINDDGTTTELVSGFPPGPPTQPPRAIDLDQDAGPLATQVNARVPSERALTFEWQTVVLDDDDDMVATALVPTGWDVGTTIRPPSNSDEFGFWTKIRYNDGCQGFCTPQDWKTIVMDNPSLSPFATMDDPNQLTLLVDQELSAPAGRLTVTQLADPNFAEISVTVARWSDEADHFFSCTVDLAPEDIDLWPAFADACITAQPSWF